MPEIISKLQIIQDEIESISEINKISPQNIDTGYTNLSETEISIFDHELKHTFFNMPTSKKVRTQVELEA